MTQIVCWHAECIVVAITVVDEVDNIPKNSHRIIELYMKILKSACPKTDSWWTPLMTGFLLDIEPLTTTSWL